MNGKTSWVPTNKALIHFSLFYCVVYAISVIIFAIIATLLSSTGVSDVGAFAAAILISSVILIGAHVRKYALAEKPVLERDKPEKQTKPNPIDYTELVKGLKAELLPVLGELNQKQVETTLTQLSQQPEFINLLAEAIAQRLEGKLSQQQQPTSTEMGVHKDTGIYLQLEEQKQAIESLGNTMRNVLSLLWVQSINNPRTSLWEKWLNQELELEEATFSSNLFDIHFRLERPLGDFSHMSQTPLLTHLMAHYFRISQEGKYVSPMGEQELRKIPFPVDFSASGSHRFGSSVLITPYELLLSGYPGSGKSLILLRDEFEEISSRWASELKFSLFATRRKATYADLFRIKGIDKEYADLLRAAHIHTVTDLAQQSPKAVYQKLVDINREKRIVDKLPTLSQVRDWITQAKQLPELITVVVGSSPDEP